MACVHKHIERMLRATLGFVCVCVCVCVDVICSKFPIFCRSWSISLHYCYLFRFGMLFGCILTRPSTSWIVELVLKTARLLSHNERGTQNFRWHDAWFLHKVFHNCIKFVRFFLGPKCVVHNVPIGLISFLAMLPGAKCSFTTGRQAGNDLGSVHGGGGG